MVMSGPLLTGYTQVREWVDGWMWRVVGWRVGGGEGQWVLRAELLATAAGTALLQTINNWHDREIDAIPLSRALSFDHR